MFNSVGRFLKGYAESAHNTVTAPFNEAGIWLRMRTAWQAADLGDGGESDGDTTPYAPLSGFVRGVPDGRRSNQGQLMLKDKSPSVPPIKITQRSTAIHAALRG